MTDIGVPFLNRTESDPSGRMFLGGILSSICLTPTQSRCPVSFSIQLLEDRVYLPDHFFLLSLPASKVPSSSRMSSWVDLAAVELIRLPGVISSPHQRPGTGPSRKMKGHASKRARVNPPLRGCITHCTVSRNFGHRSRRGLSADSSISVALPLPV